jgi:hypothetical protein
MSNNKLENQTSENINNADTDMSRRDAMKKMGKYAAYTAPAMMTLLASKKTIAASIPF